MRRNGLGEQKHQEWVRAQVYKVIKAEKLLDKAGHDELCGKNIRLQVCGEHISHVGRLAAIEASLAGIQKDIRTILIRLGVLNGE